MPDLQPFNALVSKDLIRKNVTGFQDCKSENTLLADSKAHLYLYLQNFPIPGTGTASCRRGIVGLVPAKDADQILGHENVISENVQELLQVIEKTGISLPPVHAFHIQQNHILKNLFAEDLDLISDFRDDSDVQNSLFRIVNNEKALQIRNFYSNIKIYLADGHHRLHAQKQLISKYGSEKSGFLLVYLSDLTICPEQVFPFHRLLKLNIEKNDFLIKLSRFFTVTPINLFDVLSEIEGKKYHYGLYIDNKSFIIKLKEGLEENISWRFPDPVKKLDLTVLHYYAFQEAAGIKGSTQKDSKEIKFSSIFTDCVSMVKSKELDAAFFCNPVNIKDIIEVADSGNVLPQKATSFYPKVNSGLVFAFI